MAKYYKKISDEDGNEFLLAVNITGHGAPTEDTEAEPGMCYLDEDSEHGDLYKCIGVLVTETRTVYRWKKLAGQEEVERLSKAIADLPQSDWNQNDPEQPDYVKNRPFYSEDEEVLVIDNEKKRFPLNGYRDIEGYMYSGFEISLTPGYPVTVILDGSTYNTTVKELSNPDYSAPFYYCGNGALFGIDDEDTGVPFILFNCPDVNALVLPIVGEPNFDVETHIITIRSMTKKYNRMPQEYLPGLANENEYGFVKAAFTYSTDGFAECYIGYDGKLYAEAQPALKHVFIHNFGFPSNVGDETITYYDETSDIGVSIDNTYYIRPYGHFVLHINNLIENESLNFISPALDGTAINGVVCSQVVGGTIGNIYHVVLKHIHTEERYMLSVKRIM